MKKPTDTKPTDMKPTDMKQNADRFVNAIFCDDIRQEVGNKVSFMGCYQGELFVPFVPMMLPKLCVQVTISTTVERPIKSLTVRLDHGVNQLAVIEVPADDFVRFATPAAEDAFQWSVHVGVMLSPFTITEPGELRVVVITEEGEMSGPHLRLKVMPAEPLAPAVAAKKVVARRASAKKVK
jgi:hypothetical protein